MFKMILNILRRLNRPIVIIGHDNVDVDSCITGILLQQYLKHRSIDCTFKIPDGEIEEETINAMKSVNIDILKYVAAIEEDDCLILVDHHETNYSNKVIGCIDHHPTEDWLKYHYKFYINHESSSCAKELYDLLRCNTSYRMEPIQLCLVVFSIYMDTCSLKNSKCLPKDVAWAMDIIHWYHFDEVFFYQSGLCLTDINKPIETLILHGIKKYCFNGHNVFASYVQLEGDLQNKNDCISYIKEHLKENNCELWIFIISDFIKNETTEYRIKEDGIELNRWNHIASRGQEIIPLIEKLYS